MPLYTNFPQNAPRASYAGNQGLQLAISGADQDLAMARAQAEERRRMLLLDYGDPTLAQTYYGGDSGYVGSVRANPYGLQQRMAKNYGRGQDALNENMNQRNLWYGGHRAKALTELAEQYGEQRYDASQGTNRALMEISDFLLAAEAEARNRKIAAEIDAYNQALQTQIPRA
jgi:hypothetical protein